MSLFYVSSFHFSLRLPGSKTKLLEQKIPATYLALEDVVGGIASELRAGGSDPVLNQVKHHFVVLQRPYIIKYSRNPKHVLKLKI